MGRQPVKKSAQLTNWDRFRKIVIGIAGGTMLIVGVIMIPYPGPGWLVVFASLALLSREFHWARRLLYFARGLYDRWVAWLSRQRYIVRAAFWLATATLVVVTLWVMNGYGMLHKIFYPELHADWLYSPFVRR